MPAEIPRSVIVTYQRTFEEEYRHLLDSELLRLAAQRSDLVPEAALALDAELESRHLGASADRGTSDNQFSNEKCPLCGSMDAMGWQARLLYEKPVCGRCSRSLWNRRAVAHYIDLFFYLGIVPVIGISVFSTLGVDWFTSFILVAFSLYLLRDGPRLSIGKALAGVEVIDTHTNQRAGFVASLKRNLPLFLPFAPIIVAFQMKKGPRLGDGWANTRVILKKYRGKEPFIISPKIGADGASQAKAVVAPF